MDNLFFWREMRKFQFLVNKKVYLNKAMLCGHITVLQESNMQKSKWFVIILITLIHVQNTQNINALGADISGIWCATVSVIFFNIKNRLFLVLSNYNCFPPIYVHSSMTWPHIHIFIHLSFVINRMSGVEIVTVII